jgi:O-antigen ligase
LKQKFLILNNKKLNKKKKLVISNVIPTPEKTIFEKIYFLFFIILPIIYSESIIDPVLIPRQIFLTLFIFIVGLSISYQLSINKIQAEFTFLKTPFFISLLIFLTSILLSFSKSIIISESIYLFSKILSLILFLIITTYLILQKQLRNESLIKSVVWFTIIILSIAFYQIFNLYQIDEKFIVDINQITSSNGNKNLLASILFLSLPFILYSIGTEKRLKYISIIIVFIILIIFWILQTKTVIIGFILFFILNIVFLMISKSQEISKLRLLLLVVPIVLVIISITYISVKYQDLFPHLFSGNTFKTRVLLWKNSWQMIKENTLFGVGAGNWQIYFPKFGLDKFGIGDVVANGAMTYQRPHNDFLWIFCEMGIMGIISYLFLFVSFFYYGIKLIKNQQGEKTNWLYALFLSTIIGYILISFADFPFERIEHQIVLFTIFSIVLGNYYLNKKTELKPLNVKLSTFSITLLVLFIFLMTVSTKRYNGEFHTSQMNLAYKNSNWNKVIEEVDLSNNLFYSIDPMSIPLVWYKGVALFASENIIDAKIEFDKAYKIDPYNIHVLNNLASCYEKLGNHKDAELYYKKALKISSLFEETLLNLAAIYFNTKKFELAFETIDKCSVNSVDPKYRLFLKTILVTKIDSIIEHTVDKNKVQQLTLLKTDTTRLETIYFESKSILMNFEPYVLKSLI